MIIRTTTDTEKQRADEIFYISFEFQQADQKPTPPKKSHTDKNHTDKNQKTIWAAFEDDNKTMISSLSQIPYSINFDGSTCTMGGIGGVATLPHHRKSGGTTGCLHAAIKSMYENDYAFSYLYPFSTRYYNKFGYANCCQNIKYTINLHTLTPYDIGGHCHLIEKHNNYIEDITKVYDRFAHDYNMMIVKGANTDWATKANPAQSTIYSYLYKNDHGIPKGIMEFKKATTNNQHIIECTKFFFSDLEGLKGLLNHTHAFSNYYNYISFFLPSNIDISPLITEWAQYDNKRELVYAGMVRAINAEKILKTAKYIGTGDLTLKITDDIIPANKATYHITYHNSILENVKIVDTTPDITVDIALFSQLICGVHETSKIPLYTTAIITGDRAKLPGVFYKKKLNICELF